LGTGDLFNGPVRTGALYAPDDSLTMLSLAISRE